MATTNGTYSNVNDALDKLYAWANTQGWTQEAKTTEGTGQRAHISKTINGVAVYAHFRSAVAENGVVTGHLSLTGIGVGVSTGINSPATTGNWNEQPGFSKVGFGSSSPGNGAASQLDNSGGDYYFFATPTTLSAVFSSASYHEDWKMVTVGLIGDCIGYIASAGHISVDTSTTQAQSAYLVRNYHTNASTYIASMALYVPSIGWYTDRLNSSGESTTQQVNKLVAMYGNAGDPDACSGSLAHPIVAASPDSFKGNTVLAPTEINITQGTVGRYYPVGHVEGVKLLNMTQLVNEEQISFGGDNYRVFRHTNNPATTNILSGVAFKE